MIYFASADTFNNWTVEIFWTVIKSEIENAIKTRFD